MKGVLLGGGSGTRLNPLTRVTNKHLLPVYNKPMLYYPLEFLISLGIKNVILVAGREYAGDFAELLGDGSELGINITYRIQNKPLGIAHAIGLTGPIFKDENLAVILGDNIFKIDKKELTKIKSIVMRFDAGAEGCRLFLKCVTHPERFGVPVFDRMRKIIKIEEKPIRPKSRYVVTGFYLYDTTVYDRIKKLKPSNRRELEVTDLNNSYLLEGKLEHTIIKGKWSDAGTFESLYKATAIARDIALDKVSVV